MQDLSTPPGSGAEQISATPATSPSHPLVPDSRPPIVLLVEDDPGDALLVEELVADCRPALSLRWARSMAEAVAVLRAEAVDCVLLDLHLTDAHGLEALATVRAAAAGTAVVVLTGLAEQEAGLAAVAAGAQDYLVKGRVDPEWLSRAIQYAVQRTVTEQSAAALQASQLRAEENARLERGLLPTPLLGEDEAPEIVARYHPGRAQSLLGGDFYDVVQLPDGTVEVLIGDVSGHGPDEAALGVALRIAWRTLVLSGIDGTQRLRQLDQILGVERARDHTFATLTCLSLLPDRRRARVVRAGHPGLMVRSGDRVEWLEVPGGPALGIFPDAEWPSHDVLLPEPGALVLFTDGLFEGRVDANGGRLGEDGLLAAARQLGGLPAPEFVDRLIHHAQSLAEGFGGLDDDVAVLHVRWTETS